jgi:2-polyprenyl-3-methyl-5-hydroxy-6-metoxy-1,4-benzoquinol methylase
VDNAEEIPGFAKLPLGRAVPGEAGMLAAGEYDVRRSLLGIPPWLTEKYSIDAGGIKISGWAIPPDGCPGNWNFFVNGRGPDLCRYPSETPALNKIFPFCPGSSSAGFYLELAPTEADEAMGHIEIAFVNKYSRLPASDFFNQFVDLTSQIEIPGEDQLFRTQGNRSAERYKLHGYTTYKRLELALYRHSGRYIQDFHSVLDWGCGCGRLTQQLVNRLSDSNIHGIDIDEQNVLWCGQHIAKARFDVVPLSPPTLIEDNTYDLIVGISVMTHLDLEMQHAWLKELKRIAKPSAYVILTTHGEAALARVKNFEVIERAIAVGSDDSTKDGALQNIINSTNYYRASYHLRFFVRGLFGQYFDLIEIIPGGNASIQDIIVMRKAPA